MDGAHFSLSLGVLLHFLPVEGEAHLNEGKKGTRVASFSLQAAVCVAVVFGPALHSLHWALVLEPLMASD